MQFPDVMFDALDELEQLIVAIPTDKDDAGFMTCKLAAMAKAERILVTLDGYVFFWRSLAHLYPY